MRTEWCRFTGSFTGLLRKGNRAVHVWRTPVPWKIRPLREGSLLTHTIAQGRFHSVAGSPNPTRRNLSPLNLPGQRIQHHILFAALSQSCAKQSYPLFVPHPAAFINICGFPSPCPPAAESRGSPRCWMCTDCRVPRIHDA